MTIKELSQELGVSEQALRSWCKKNNVRKERTKGTKATYVLDSDAILKAKSYYLNESKESKETKEGNQSKQSNESTQQTNNTKLIDSLTEQLQIKDKQISELQRMIADAAAERDKDRNERQAILTQLFSLQSDNKELQTELNKYKAIAESKNNVVEVDTINEHEESVSNHLTPETEQQPQKELAEDLAPQKLSFFKRLFRKRS